MIPIRTAVPSRYPPIVTWALISANCIVFLFQQSLSPVELDAFVDQFALIPARCTDVFVNGDADGTALLPFVTMMFLHGGWLHLIFNMWTLWLFGPTVEDRLGYGRYVAFYFGCGIAASLAQVIFDPTSTVPVLGASGAIAGVLGGYMSLFPFSRVIVVVPILFIPLFFEMPAVVFIGFWFLVQLFQGTAELFAPSASGGVASWAHVGGFIVGLVLIPFIQRSRRSYRVYYRDEGILGFNTQGR
jgi:membrane associated rhomboid family serine protease